MKFKIFIFFIMLFMLRVAFPCDVRVNPHSFDCTKDLFDGDGDIPGLSEKIAYLDLSRSLVQDQRNLLDGVWRALTFNAAVRSQSPMVKRLRSSFRDPQTKRIPVNVLNVDSSRMGNVFIQTRRKNRANFEILLTFNNFVERQRVVRFTYDHTKKHKIPLSTEDFKTPITFKATVKNSQGAEIESERLKCIVFTRNLKSNVPVDHLLCEWSAFIPSLNKLEFFGYLGFLKASR